MKRHHFRGGDATHGSMFHRAPGGIGASTYPSRVFPGTRMAGRMGCDRVTLKQRARWSRSTSSATCCSSRVRSLAAPTALLPGQGVKGGEAMKLEVRNWENSVVGEIDLPDEVFTYPTRPHLVYEVVQGLPGRAAPGHPLPPRTAHRSPAAARSPGSRRALVAPASVRRARPCGDTAAPTFGPQPRYLRHEGQRQGEEERAALGALRAHSAAACCGPRVARRRRRHRTKDMMTRIGAARAWPARRCCSSTATTTST